MHGQVAKGVVELLVVHPKQAAYLFVIAANPLQHGISLLLLLVVHDAELH